MVFVAICTKSSYVIGDHSLLHAYAIEIANQHQKRVPDRLFSASFSCQKPKCTVATMKEAKKEDKTPKSLAICKRSMTLNGFREREKQNISPSQTIVHTYVSVVVVFCLFIKRTTFQSLLTGSVSTVWWCWWRWQPMASVLHTNACLRTDTRMAIGLSVCPILRLYA